MMRFFALIITIIPSLCFADNAQFKAVTRSGGACDKECPVLVFEGAISSETLKQFAELDLNSADTIVLNSLAGDLEPSMELGRAIRRNRLATRIARLTPSGFEPGFCKGGCALTFLGGIQRDAPPDDNALVFERPNNAEILAGLSERTFTALDRLKEQIAVGLFVTYLSEMGVSPEIYAEVSKLRPGSNFPIDEALAVSLRIAMPRAQLQWRMASMMDGIVLETEFPGQPTIGLFCYSNNSGLRLQLTFEHVRAVRDSSAQQVCIGSRCVSVQELRQGRDLLYLTAGENEFPVQLADIFDDPVHKGGARLEFIIPELAWDAVLGARRLAIATRGMQIRNNIMLERDLEPLQDARMSLLVRRNCL
ncbi:hypothetical protein [Thioclava pacifica]|uniref:DUF4384 domain-containing protein n=1 Tax=Thioclava pacifica DSM 10166 TaxID=1353537 RepID=A0A074JC74_9RHOB|nr:hypothetical protein [Thioclava pacifica]KEO53450.1 hypothetical protein TP2_17825 [Thioclava pacifica DSM 10166]